MGKFGKVLTMFCLCFVLMVPVTAHAFTKVEVVLDGEKVNFSPSAGVANGYTMVPFRQLFEALGATVHYDEKTNTVTASKEGTKIKLTQNSFNAYINGELYILNQTPTTDNSGRLFVNLRFISEGLGYKVDWDQKNLKVFINSSI
jgi:hypothetical protein